jgi:hypothetical protein
MNAHEFYETRANEARAEAEAALLDNVRDRCLRAAMAWDVMAERARYTDALRAKREATKPADPDPAPQAG